MARQPTHHVSITHRTPRRFHTMARPVQSKIKRVRLDREQLKIFLSGKAIFVLMFFALVLMFSPYVLVGFMTPEERDSIAELHRNPEAMRMLYLLIMCKMVGLGSLFTCMPLVKHWFFDRKRESAIMSLEPAPEKMKSPSLSVAQRVVLTHGAVAHGRVVEVKWPNVTVRYQGPWGERHTRKLRASRGVKEEPRVGDELPLLIDPQAPAEVVAPSLLEVIFEDLGEILDVRPEPRELAHRLEGPEPEGPERLELRSTLHPIKPPMLLSFRRRLSGRRQLTARVGSLQLDGCVLVQRMEPHGKQTRVALDEPFVVSLAVWLLDEERAELKVSIRARGDRTSKEAIRWRTELSQRQLSRALPLKQAEGLPYLEAQDFEAIWPILKFHASAHGDDLSKALDLSRSVAAPPASEHEEVAAVEAVERQSA